MSAFAGTCCAALASISRFCEQYALGIATTVYIIEACEVESIPAATADSHTISTDLVLKTDKFF
ncbi:MAG: hypothetical protein AAFU67_13180, partial [Bacteroidota bacterium]